MGIYEFNSLSDHDKYDTVFTNGQFVDSVKDGRITYALYSLSYFWVEVMYDSPMNKILEIGSFVEGGSLDRYSNVPKSF
ncbi:hypothetical protein [Maribacter flavus]|uniref:Uncharacterized protein n=1 Tax=Maribacter flavus TaxID=1658664 RepID=A0A5B2TX45_9FLAO|nr:hypothetical protein [Maribacter flavus]KAA2218538.1 hypothetical protein F0361_02640 [Maribacter flavus]